MGYRRVKEKKDNYMPKRIIFYRGMLSLLVSFYQEASYSIDGVSEGQFKQVLDDGEYLPVLPTHNG